MPVRSAGFVIAFHPDRQGLIRRIRIENQNYIEARNLRGHAEDLRITLLDLMLHHPKQDMNRFLAYFPIYRGEVRLMNQLMTAWQLQMIEVFYARYQDKQIIDLPPRQHAFLRTIHENVGHISKVVIEQQLALLPIDYVLGFLL